jgi:hypothetical protein
VKKTPQADLITSAATFAEQAGHQGLRDFTQHVRPPSNKKFARRYATTKINPMHYSTITLQGAPVASKTDSAVDPEHHYVLLGWYPRLWTGWRNLASHYGSINPAEAKDWGQKLARSYEGLKVWKVVRRCNRPLKPAPKPKARWSYSQYRATLKLDGKFFALVSDERGRALTVKQCGELLRALNHA